MIIEENKGYVAKRVKVIDGLGRDILYLLSNRSMSVSEIARELGKSEQLISYYINKKIIDFIETVRVDGKVKYRAYKAYYDIINDREDFFYHKTERKNLEPFIKDGFLDCIIVVGSPIPHGPFSASSRDLHYVGFLTSYLGRFFDKAKYDDFIRLDIDVNRENLLKENLILIGGPVANHITYRINTSLKVRFLQEYNWDIYSDLTGKRYSDELVSLIANINNPFDGEKRIILLAGKRALGTKIAIKYFISNELDLSKDFYIVINGVDEDSDGKPEKIIELERYIK